LKTHEKHIPGKIDIIWEAILLIYQSDNRFFWVRLGMIVLKGLLPIGLLYAFKFIIDGISNVITHPNEANYSVIWIFAAVYSGIFLSIRIIDIIDQFSNEILTQKLTDFISNALHKKSTELDLAYYDNSKYHDTFHRAQQEAGFRPIQILNNLSGLMTNGISFIGTMAIFSTFSWLGIVVVVIAGLPSLWVKVTKSKTLFNWKKVNTPVIRKSNYLSTLMTGRVYAKEIRVFRLATYFQEQFVAIREKLVQQIISIHIKQRKYDLLSLVFEGGALFAIIYLLCNRAFYGAITIGSFVMFFEAFRRGQGSIQAIVSNLSGIYENKLFLSSLFEFLHLQPTIISPEKPVSFPKHIKEIRFQNISFAYPECDKKTINNFSLTAKMGEVTLIRGENGWGKSTLIKLLLRLYECTDGAIFINDIDIKNFDIQELRKNISVIFQDFVQFDVSVRDNITFGSVEKNNDDSLLEKAAALSDSQSIISRLPLQYDTILGKYFENGEELSMGQWQRIALGRALFNDTPVLVFDEPTSWMDSKSESKFLQNLSHLKKNKIVLLISHSPTDEIKIDNRSSVHASYLVSVPMS
jgi:ATP-binding cassette, subfamily B, bacterial